MKVVVQRTKICKHCRGIVDIERNQKVAAVRGAEDFCKYLQYQMPEESEKILQNFREYLK